MRARASLLAGLILVVIYVWNGVKSEPFVGRPFDGFNVIVTSGHPFGSASAKLSLHNIKRLGARAVAIVPFFWQSAPASPDLVRGEDMSDDELREAIRDAHALGLAVLVKPHVWVPESWAGAVAMNTVEDWQRWFASYERELKRIAGIAEDEKAEALAVGTELAKTTHRAEWSGLIAVARRAYSGHLIYVAHNLEEAEAIPFWGQLDAVGVSLYPPLGDDGDRDGRRATMRAVADGLDALSARTGKSILVGEIGLRSAQGAAAKPWESAEERQAAPDPDLQEAVLADWLAVLDRPSIEGVMIWRWLTDPNAGGAHDTDFTVQDKPAERILSCLWIKRCSKEE
jgi:hypothetical protein